MKMVESPKASTLHETASLKMEEASQPSFWRKWRKVVLFLFAFAFSFAAASYFMLSASTSLPWPMMNAFPRSRNQMSIPIQLTSDQQANLHKVLKEAAMEDKTIILTTLNGAWAAPNSILDVFMESFRIGEGTSKLLEHLVMVAMDDKAYDRCKSIHSHCFALIDEKNDFTGEKDFMTDGYFKMMWKRTDFLRVVLELGYNFIFTDTDIVWFRNPMLHFHPQGDFQIACDRFNGNELDLNNRPNGGFIYVKSNNRTIKFYKYWLESRLKFPGLNEQDVLNKIKFDRFVKSLGIKMYFLNTAYFGGICEKSRDFNKVCTMHANCCIGLSRKIVDLGVMLDDWRAYMALPPAEKKGKQLKWRVPRNCRYGMNWKMETNVTAIDILIDVFVSDFHFSFAPVHH